MKEFDVTITETLKLTVSVDTLLPGISTKSIQNVGT